MDSKEFDSFFSSHYSLLYAYARQFVRDEDAKDIIQDLMVWFWLNHKDIILNVSVKGYLLKAVKNRALNLINRKKTNDKVNLAIKNKHCLSENPDIYLSRELLTHFESALQSMPREFRTVFEMNRFQNMTYQQISGKLDVSVQTVNYRITQALKILRKELSEFLSDN
ncbi:MAG: RNA polymerase sigma-70 factor [Bacteroidales bacterium]|jgi:RNA polymerase sigma-70 factor (ECF subfamily)|nr:RNA polymerase sigma-70 factor [Bacteroidales bacterium]MDD4654327.1 RNA polymerase sigma-70 factor [Bacteroidales bacterium]MDD4827669.1 RNA polymerase sigma-70 factor [Bacteroidales bacterium]